MARQRASLRGRLGEKKEESWENLPGTFSKKRSSHFPITNLGQRGITDCWQNKKDVEQEVKQEHFPFSLPVPTRLKR